MWVHRSGEFYQERPVVIYEYQKDRDQQKPLEFYRDYKGILVTDGLQQYHLVDKKLPDVTNANCWAHARRDFADAVKAMDKKVVMAAADTFRAAAIEQLTEWANRTGCDIIAQSEASAPSAVIFDSIAAAKARNAAVLLCDPAGRLHNKNNLMEELRKIDRVIEREYADAYRENLIVLDATTGQNALAQLKEFKEVTDITGIILTKMDGTAKGGIAVAIQAEYGIPVKYIGVGETIDDLQKFDSGQFVNALFDVKEDSGEEGETEC